MPARDLPDGTWIVRHGTIRQVTCVNAIPFTRLVNVYTDDEVFTIPGSFPVELAWDLAS